ncbi:transposase [Paenarthrobacter sp. Z7-10]|nr:transposase [Paenarthrobacter sp. Z7-10]
MDQDADRCADAGIPAERTFATKPELAKDMIIRALDGGVPAMWVTGDAVYGQHSGLHWALEELGVHYVLNVPVIQRLMARTGPLGTEFRADQLIASFSGRSWRTRSAGAGAMGDRR